MQPLLSRISFKAHLLDMRLGAHIKIIPLYVAWGVAGTYKGLGLCA
ncbi:hypothetical protein BN341_12090 [Helicobacter heilmannii ASB1.4]|uniref:Uncharacterized protein n=1 Tax=Helicobacter heilmannii TaxID=35817 RepID=A0A0K2YD77_HELHE|nr:hypothetical protein BN341_12090 [Helicobacter heilmannii ASB1.4]CRI34955.1 hypothetical protein HHE01_07560 [Helicobacter heilmannii]